ncbi:MAG: YkgJ family cysteine cluster protein [Bacteriovoracaceae bacterium]|nr:YkgJ family cysteine cluster protein [Bacteriovoracaceae bacterium]
MDKYQAFNSELMTLFQKMSTTFSGLQNNSGLTCLNECGECCLSPQVECTILEALPLALEQYQKGEAEQVLEQLKNSQAMVCHFYQAHSADGKKGRCGIYEQRPGICRMFGAYARRNKSQDYVLGLCKLIREKHGEDLNGIALTYEHDMAYWRQLMNSIAPALSEHLYPINQAFELALEHVLSYYHFSSMKKVLES